MNKQTSDDRTIAQILCDDLRQNHNDWTLLKDTSKKMFVPFSDFTVRIVNKKKDILLEYSLSEVGSTVELLRPDTLLFWDDDEVKQFKDIYYKEFDTPVQLDKPDTAAINKKNRDIRNKLLNK